MFPETESSNWQNKALCVTANPYVRLSAVPKGGPGVLGDGRNPPLVGTARDGPSTAAVVALWCGKMQEIS